MTTKTAATVAGSPAAHTHGLPVSEMRRLRADLVLGPRTERDQRQAAFAVDCGRLSGLTLIADLEGISAVASILA